MITQPNDISNNGTNKTVETVDYRAAIQNISKCQYFVNVLSNIWPFLGCSGMIFGGV